MDVWYSEELLYEEEYDDGKMYRVAWKDGEMVLEEVTAEQLAEEWGLNEEWNWEELEGEGEGEEASEGEEHEEQSEEVPDGADSWEEYWEKVASEENDVQEDVEAGTGGMSAGEGTEEDESEEEEEPEEDVEGEEASEEAPGDEDRTIRIEPPFRIPQMPAGWGEPGEPPGEPPEPSPSGTPSPSGSPSEPSGAEAGAEAETRKIDEEVGKRLLTYLTYELAVYISDRSPYRVKTNAFLSPESLGKLFREAEKKRTFWMKKVADKKKIYSFTVDFTSFVEKYMPLYESIMEEIRQGRQKNAYQKLLILVAAMKVKAQIIQLQRERIRYLMEYERKMDRLIQQIERVHTSQRKIYQYVSGQRLIEVRAEELSEKAQKLEAEREELAAMKEELAQVEEKKSLIQRGLELAGKVKNAVVGFLQKAAGKVKGIFRGKNTDTGGPDI